MRVKLSEDKFRQFLGTSRSEKSNLGATDGTPIHTDRLGMVAKSFVSIRVNLWPTFPECSRPSRSPWIFDFLVMAGRLTPAVIASHEGTNPNHINQMLFRLRAALKECIQRRLAPLSQESPA